MRRQITPILSLVAICLFIGLSACSSSDQPSENEQNIDFLVKFSQNPKMNQPLLTRNDETKKVRCHTPNINRIPYKKVLISSSSNRSMINTLWVEQ